MPAHNKQGIRSFHAGIVTRIAAMCPGARLRTQARVAQRERSVCEHATFKLLFAVNYSGYS
jgi:hypothetical protein